MSAGSGGDFRVDVRPSFLYNPPSIFRIEHPQPPGGKMIPQLLRRIARASALSAILLPFAGSIRAQEQNAEPVMAKIAFANVYLKSALSVLAKNLKFEVEYDNSVKNQMVEIELENVSVSKAITTIFEQYKLWACLNEDNALLIFADTDDNRKKFAKHKLWPVKPEPEK
jgi:hypothetical protein